MQKRFRTIFAVALWLIAGSAFSTPQSPMEFLVFQPCRGSGSMCGARILASGVIESNSHVKLERFIANTRKGELPALVTIVFDSPGGSVLGGMALGGFIRKRGFDTALEKDVEEEVRVGGFSGGTEMRTIAADTVCASACSLAYLGGRARSMTPDARLGVHQFYSVEGNIGDGATQITMTRLAMYVEAMGVDRRLLDFASSAGPSEMRWLDDKLARELRIDNTRPLLADWRIETDSQGLPHLGVRQALGPNRDLALVLENGGAHVTVTLLVNIARDAPGSSRQNLFPVGYPAKIKFVSGEKTVAVATPVLNWQRVRTDADGSAVFAGVASISYPDLQRIAAVRVLEILDVFPSAIYDLGISTPLSVVNFAGGAALLMRTRGSR